MLKNRVFVLLSTYNGVSYLDKQLDSLMHQTYTNLKIIARDDASLDETLIRLQSYDIEILSERKNVGIKKSFSILLEDALKNQSDYFMFCDQDDVWNNDKVEKTLKKMKELERVFPDSPLLIHTDLEVVDENLKTIDKSMWHYENLDPNLNNFNRLLMQNTITGCTVMINRKLASMALPIPREAIMHDWWFGLVASKFGKIGFVNEATIKYRQHQKNSIGSHRFSLQYILSKMFGSNTLQKNYKQASAFLEQYRHMLETETIEMLEEFSTMESKSFLEKRKTLWKYKLFKQGLVRNIGLFLKI